MNDLTPLFAPSGVVVVGASRQGNKLGAAMARSLAAFPGARALVNSRNPDPAAGVFASVAEARAHTGADLDLAVLCIPAAACAGALAEAAAAGCRAALVCAGGFGEIGPTGEEPERALRRVAEETGIRLLGPNTSGFLAPHRGLTASFVPGAGLVPPGGLAVVAASGGVNHALAFELAGAGNGISLGVGIGAGMGVTAADVLDHLAGDPETTAVALHLETVPDGPRLLAALGRLTAVKPVAALVVGRTDVGDFARSHTGALATSWRTTRAAVRDAGAVVVDDERELVDALTALSRVRLRPATDPGIGIVTAQAGPGLLLADRVGADGIRVPELSPGTRARLGDLLPPLTFQRNPVDTGRPSETFPELLGTVAADPEVDLLAVYALTEPGSVDLAAAAEAAGLPSVTPAVVAIGGPAEEVREQRARLHKLGVPAVTTPVAAANAVRALVTDARLRAERDTAEPASGNPVPKGPLDEHAAKTFLETLGVRTPPRRACASRQEAHQALADLGGAVAVKVLDARILHKTETGGVRLNVRTPADLDSALDAIGADRVLVEAMASTGVDLVVGARRDPVFGPVVLAGLGGTAAEALADVAIRLAPVSPVRAAAMPDELAAGALLHGWRGGPVLDRREFGVLVSALSAVLSANPDVTEIEINPLRLTSDGLVALDAVVVRREEDHA
ncbi:acetate--CoA ligase family protein [Actinomadura mexicana]|uniref:Acetyltransferase n=1 Tax=Actinomadura mexicana TaxID=134959 RepID=A0A238ULN4_9ACTN|nr:acetate--CoA ligase family protein [Actinomadura mexicana]SNR22945.1 acetyltransferase [Actinomadura mexicana]